MTSGRADAGPQPRRRVRDLAPRRPRLAAAPAPGRPGVWMVVVYLGSLAILLLNAFWDKDAFTGEVNPFDWSLDAFEEIIGNEVYRTIAVRTVSVAVLVTVTDALLAFPIAYYMARVASPRVAACWSSRSSCRCGPPTW